jgi:nucleoside-diphosphate-sugar epimerase
MVVGITGSTGTIGSILKQRLLLNNLEINEFNGDIRNKEDIQNWYKSDFDAIFHLAALVPIKKVNENPLDAYSINVGGTINLLEVITIHENKPWIFYAGSAHVYKSKKSPIKEDDTIEPITLYGETKWMAEKICIETAKSFQLSLCAGRIFSFYHKSQKKPFLYPAIVERLKSEDLNKPFVLSGADSIRDFLNAESVVEVLLKLYKKRSRGIVNIASGKGIKIKDFVQSISAKRLNIEQTGDKFDYLVADTNRLISILGEEIES